MRTGPDAGAVEEPREITEYLRAAGHELSTEQLERLHRRRLVLGPLEGAGALEGGLPPGTAERVLRISRLRSHVRQFDEIAWRLWWEGEEVDPLLVRAFAERRSLRWNGLAREDDGAAPVAERDVLEDVFFRHLKKSPSSTSSGRALERGAATFAAITRLRCDLDDPESLDGAALEATLLAGPLGGLLGDGDVDFMKAVVATSDDGLRRARRIARHVLAVVEMVGTAIQRASGPGRRDTVGRTFLAMSDSPNDQVLFVLLACTILDAPSVSDRFDGDDVMTRGPAVGFDEFRALRSLAATTPALAALLEPERFAEIFDSPDALALWRQELAELGLDLPAARSRQTLVEDEPEGSEEPDGDSADDDQNAPAKKKNPE